jgi:glycosyltransferase involved in cell wall biosynthesis
LPAAIDSIINQTLQPLEIIVVDDGSTDKTAEMLAENYPGVLTLSQENLGVSSARNSGVEHSKGNWIAFLDSDDLWLPDKLEKQVELLNEFPGHRLCHSNEMWIRNGRRVNPMNKHKKSGGQIFEACLPICAISPSSALIEKQLLQEVGGFDEDLPACEDYDLWLRICAVHPVLYVEEPLLKKFGGHKDQLSRKFWGMDRFRVEALEKIIASGALTKTQELAASNVLLKKCRILADGARKRKKQDREKFYRDKVRILEA